MTSSTVFKIFICFILSFGFSIGQGQTSYNPQSPPNTFRNADNPFYWKNKLPHPGYWQQDVHYEIKADVDELTDIITGSQKLTYWNNSPDTLYEVFFHLYENAYQPGSYLDNLQKNNQVKVEYGHYEKQGFGTTIQSFRHEGEDMEIELDNTVFRVKLNKPLLPNASTFFEVEFKTYFQLDGNVRRRNKAFTSYGAKQFNGVHWYPIICVYDAKFGWTTDQHLGREFYANFGTFDVELTFANNYIVEATGNLLNREEVLPDTLREKLDIKLFREKPLYSAPGEIIPYIPGERKKWHFYAENVHNFAFTANPHYRIGETEWNGIQCIALVQEPHASRWQTVAEFTAQCVELFSNDFGMYGYHKMVVADARDGMEYPMLTLCGGLEPSNHGLIAHEVGHNWFYGIIGTNETYRAWMDEGLTQFLTAWALEALEGKYDRRIAIPKNRYKRKFREPVDARTTTSYWGYLSDAVTGEDAFLNTHSDGFHGALRQGGGYRHVYSKTSVMLYNLQYVLGDSLFTQAMLHFYDRWKFAHPYPEDFRNAFIQFTKVDLNWFFDQWLETMKNVDYRIGRVRRVKDGALRQRISRDEGRGTSGEGGTRDKGQGTGDGGGLVEGQTVTGQIVESQLVAGRGSGNVMDENTFIANSEKSQITLTRDYLTRDLETTTENSHIYTITFKRKGRMQMPLDILITTRSNDSLYFHIPNQWFLKETSATVLPKWHGWDKLHPVYTATVALPDKIKSVVIDPSERLADVYMPDNSKPRRVKLRFDSQVWNYPDWKNYRMYWRPAIWWNAYDGIKLGLHLNGNYLNYKHRFSLTVWGITTLGRGSAERFGFPQETTRNFDPINYRFDYRTTMDKLLRNSNVFVSALYFEGLEAYKLGADVRVGKKQNTEIILYMKLLNRPRDAKRNYLLYPGEWGGANEINNTVNVEMNHRYKKTNADGTFNLTLRSNGIASDFDYHYLQATHTNSFRFWKLELRSRLHGRYGTGSNPAPESALFFAQASPEEMMENVFTRSVGYFPPAWVGGFGNDVNHFHHGGGLNVRGYAGYLLVEESGGQAFTAYRGSSGGSFNAELDLDGLVNWKPKKLSNYLHLDVYLFADGGFIVYNKGINTISEAISNFRTDAGAGVALTIKKFEPFEKLKPLTLRFDMPLFLSHTPAVSPDHFQFRWVVGVGRAF